MNEHSDRSTYEGVTLPDGEFGQIMWPSEATSAVALYAEHGGLNCHVSNDPYPVGCLCGYDRASERTAEADVYAEDVIRAAHGLLAIPFGDEADWPAFLSAHEALRRALNNEGFDQ